MAEFPGLMIWTDAYLADCGHLTDAEHGRYLQMLIHLWRAPNQRFPNDDVWLSRKFCRPVERIAEEIRPLIREFFKVDAKGIYHPRIDREFSHSREVKKRRQEAANVRWNKEKPPCKSNPIPTQYTTIKDTLPSEATARKPKAPNRGSRLPADWQPSEADLEVARAEGFVNGQVARIVDGFRDYWTAIPGQRGVKADWHATWRNWVRREADKRGPTAPASYPSGGGQGASRAERPSALTAALANSLSRRAGLG